MTGLLDCYLPLFKKTIRICHQQSDILDYENFRDVIISQLENSMQNATKLDIAQCEKDAAKLAVISWLDETVLCSHVAWRNEWQSEPLQVKYLGTTIAGKQFFIQLKALPARAHQARAVFLFCLQNNFHGQYNTARDLNNLTELIIEQRNLCLPSGWQVWPNDSIVTIEALRVPLKRNNNINTPLILTILSAFIYIFSLFILQ
ncbi:DotU family type IV/VI secretion system protein [Hafnia paralvei]|uniref:DotU family type IV/VI secretion system protein n=1 Tax=Hafnia paralvei TaxID=546367 RepID=UPI000DF3143A|nr:DotU family type IV/VI secretion system protein [Hafnia paralvei]RDA61912.1 DotU family type IV/VI secretion system protein [Hafnia paralvei]RDA62973.1 DotU family type IV/VI secretion system protein [Hafnia paralvei]RDA63813.1 DotU family type IV/VI secretion system protein [Hafnia paralvei]RDA75099.1 DotU family type IV/VI secretion system protein [Hafnia paralvei]RDA75503.1 DotU family type IV/VI secretion system protein [Hafnia paralvei]